MSGGRRTGGHFALRRLAAAATVLAAVAVASAAWAQDPPHWAGARLTIDCTSQCHVVHNSANLTQNASNVNLCQSCHVGSGDAGALPINSVDKAVPGVGGFHHAFDACSVNTSLDTQTPTDTERNLRLMGADGSCAQGYVVCSTCHNQHRAESGYGGESRIGAAQEVTKDATTTGAVVSGGSFTGTAGAWYLIQVVQGGSETTSRFRYSKDNAASWVPSGCTVECVGGTDAGNACRDISGDTDCGGGGDCAVTNVGPCRTAAGSTPVSLNDLVDEGVEVTFSPGTYTGGDEWEFPTAWPFLRRTLPLNLATDSLIDSGDNTTGDDFCRDCHRSWVMTHTDVESWNDTYKSHPVGITLNANSEGYDRTVPLDGNGADQGSGGADTNATNDLRFDNSNRVQCLTCHGVHYADGNTETADGP